MISIVIPAYNCEKTIRRAVDSALNQTYQDIEVIVINDGSSDHTYDIINNYYNDIGRIKLFNQKNLGVSAARNKGIRESNGEYIIFLDADDYLVPNACELLFHFSHCYNSDIVIYGFRCGDKKILPKSQNQYNGLREFSKEYFQMIENTLIFPCWNKMFRVSKIFKFFQEEYSLGEDVLFNLEYLKNAESISIYPEDIYIYTIEEENSLNSIFRKDRFTIDCKVYQELTDLYYSSMDNNLENEVILYKYLLNKYKLNFKLLGVKKDLSIFYCIKEIRLWNKKTELKEVINYFKLKKYRLDLFEWMLIHTEGVFLFLLLRIMYSFKRKVD